MTKAANGSSYCFGFILERRLAGASYEEIARAGEGILSTVKATRAASADDLVFLLNLFPVIRH
jgi:imidazolonepropionase-like amidohydrolase